MLHFREFEAGPDPFGRKFHILFKWLQTAISLRHADTVDVKFILTDPEGARTEKTIALPHADLQRAGKDTNHRVEDAWCARIAALHLIHLIRTGEDVQKDLITLPYTDLRRYATELGAAEQAAVHSR